MKRENQPTSTLLAALFSLVITIAIVKPVALVISTQRFARPVVVSDILGLYGADALMILVIIVSVTLIWPRLNTGRWSRVVTTGVAASMALLSVFYAFSGYAFFEWGAFLTRHEVKAAIKARATTGLMEFLGREGAAVTLVGIALVFAIGASVARFAGESARRAVMTVGVIIALISGFLPLAHSTLGGRALDPATVSPLFNLAAPETDHSDGLPREVPQPDRMPLTEPDLRPLPERYERFRGAAQGMNLIVIILESVRRGNLELYGYQRDTMPNVGRLANVGAVFDNAYVHQPRSCKAMASLMLGVAPDPRLRGLTWQDARLRGHDSLPRTFKERGYGLYFGIMADRDADNYTRFLEAVSGGLDRAVGFDELDDAARPSPMVGDDMVLIDDFLRWIDSRSGPFFGVLWMNGAHFPYRAVQTPFGERSITDRYDNCLHSTDFTIGKLAERLRNRGQIDRTVILALGDHGEALGERTGDSIHGKLFFDESVRVPCVLSNPLVFPRQERVESRFQTKDLASTILFLFGEDGRFRQSVNVFRKQSDDRLYMSNVFQDFKLALMTGQQKFIYRPSRRTCLLYDVESDPGETRNVIDRLPRNEIEDRKAELIAWYYRQIEDLEACFPEP